MAARTINVRLPEALYNQIEELAKATARTKSFLAIDALKNYVQSESWHIRDIHEGFKDADKSLNLFFQLMKELGLAPLSAS